MVQSGGLNALDLLNPAEAIYKIISKLKNLSNKVSHDKIDELIKTAVVCRKVMPDFKNILGPGITLTNNEIKDIMRVIKSLENRGSLLKETNKKIAIQEGDFLNFLKPLMTAGLPLMKNTCTFLATSVLIPLGLIAAASVTDAAIQKNFFRSGTTTLIINIKQRNRRYHEYS